MSDEIQLKKELYFTNSWFLQGIYKRIDKINMFVCYQGADISITFADTSFIVRGKPFDFLREGGGYCVKTFCYSCIWLQYFFSNTPITRSVYWQR